MTTSALQQLKAFSNYHRPGPLPNVFIKASPRSGSTWLMELILTQPGFKQCSEPFDLRNEQVRRHLNIADWNALYDPAQAAELHRYINGFIENKLRFKNRSPRLRHFRPFTNRIVFKMLHGCEDRLAWLRDTFNGRIVILLRHPLPVSLSRKQLPRLEAFLESPYQRHFSAEQLEQARRIAGDGTALERGVLSWCLQTAVALQQPGDRYIVTYEQLVLDPAPVIDGLVQHLELPDRERIWRRLGVASRTTDQSDSRTQRYLAQSTNEDRSWLVEKWRQQIDSVDARHAMALLSLFGLSLYRADSARPADELWHGSKRDAA